MKWFAAAFALAGHYWRRFGWRQQKCSTVASVAVAISPDSVDRHLIVTIPYLSTPGEQYRKRRNLFCFARRLIAVLAAAIAFAVVEGISVDFSWFDRSWLDALTRLLH